MASFGPSKYGGGMKAVDRPSRGTGRAVAADLSAARPKPKLRKVLPEVWELIKPRRVLLGGSFLLMVINRFCGLILPASTKPLIDSVMGKAPIKSPLLADFIAEYHLNLLTVIVSVVVIATLIQ